MSQTREELSLELKQHIVEYLNLLDIKPEEINDDIKEKIIKGINSFK